MNRDLQIKLATIVFALIALVSMSACAVASSPSSAPNPGAAGPTPTVMPDVDSSDDVDDTAAPESETRALPESDDSADDENSSTETDSTTTVNEPVRNDDADTDTEPASDLVDTAEPEVLPGRPARLQIDAIDIDAPFEYVGVTDEGNMDVPEEWDNVAWYEPGTVPGAPGNSVVAGHYDSDSGPAVFYKLKRLSAGDTVRILTEDGEELVFEVTDVESVHVDEVDTSRIFGQTDEHNLNLITCEGSWDRSAGMYDQRLIVYTTLVSG